MTRKRVNIDVDQKLLDWIDTTAAVLGATRTETARAMIRYFVGLNPPPMALKSLIEAYRGAANQSRSAALAFHHAASRQLQTQHHSE
jgi:hypothetical protein